MVVNIKIETIKQLKDLIKDMDDDFKLEISILERIPDEVLVMMKWAYPWHSKSARIEFHDVGYSEKEVCFGVYETE